MLGWWIHRRGRGGRGAGLGVGLIFVAFCCISPMSRAHSLCLSPGGREIESCRYALMG